MKRFTIYNSEGEILRVGQCPNKDFKLQPQKGEFITEGLANQQTQKIVEGKIVEKAPHEIKSIPPTTQLEPLARITVQQWQDVLKRLDNLEKKE